MVCVGMRGMRSMRGNRWRESGMRGMRRSRPGMRGMRSLGGGCGYNFVWTFICHDDYNTLKTHSSIGKSWFEVVRVWYAWYEQVKAEYAWYAKFRGGGRDYNRDN